MRSQGRRPGCGFGAGSGWSTVAYGSRCPEGPISQHSSLLPPSSALMRGLALWTPPKLLQGGDKLLLFYREGNQDSEEGKPGCRDKALDASPGQDSAASWTRTRTASLALVGRPPPPKLCLATGQ